METEQKDASEKQKRKFSYINTRGAHSPGWSFASSTFFLLLLSTHVCFCVLKVI